jgi:hypothetical protein
MQGKYGQSLPTKLRPEVAALRGQYAIIEAMLAATTAQNQHKRPVPSAGVLAAFSGMIHQAPF